MCVSCSKIIRTCHKLISCKICKLFVHKKCTKLKQRELKYLKPDDWTCNKCSVNLNETDENEGYLNDIENLNDNITVEDNNFDKYDKMLFNPLRYENMSKEEEESNDENISGSIDIECSYITSEKLSRNISEEQADFSLFNLNIRSLNKNFDKLKECLKSVNHNFNIIGLTETQLKDKPHEYLQLPDYNLEYMNRVGRNSGGVCLYIRNDIKYKLRTDLCRANSNFESCFIEIENNNCRNILVGAIYRAHTSIDIFNTDVNHVLQILSTENKNYYLLGDFNIDLLKDETHRPTSEFLDLIYSYYLVPTILKPTRITETSATIIDNIMTNTNGKIKTGIIVTDITDHFPTVFYKNLNMLKQKSNTTNNKYVYRRNHSEDSISRFKNSLSRVNWSEILDGVDANSDYNNFFNKFNELYDECIPMKKSKTNRKKIPQSPWITKGLLKSINVKNKLYKQYLLCPTEGNSVKFRSYRNKLNNLIRKCKREYYHNKFEKTKDNIRQTWKTINCVIGRCKSKSQQNIFKTDDGH